MLTGYADKSFVIRALRNSAYDFIEKPFSKEEILLTVGRAADYIQMREEIKETKEKYLETAKLAEIGLISSKIADEINNPIQVIEGQIRFLKRCMAEQGLSDKKIEDGLEVVNKKCVVV